ncbi:MAG: PBP1A family penicillin-binding protein [Gemmatimonadota bacterium]|nr:PBP1A family penicillin-binding protein [Gemmatimonadota bacterium]MDH5758077.1 PBP1A family penicillin-binding protein [Gemmatimonadota bacterium]
MNTSHSWVQQVVRYAKDPTTYVLALVFVIAGGAGGGWGMWRNICAGEACPSIAQIETWEPEQKSKIFSHDGRLIDEIGYQSRTPVSIAALPSHVPHAIVAIEDNYFYAHGGYSLRAIARAAWGVLIGRNLGGGSTITQQLARNMFPERLPSERSYIRKLRELQVALELEQAYTKDQILEAYMNVIYMGRGYGYQNAARNYFGKNVTDINVAEAALLAAILNLPGVYDPFRHPDNARRRRDLVLSRMADEGYLTREEAAGWHEFPIPAEEPTGSIQSIAPYFQEWVRQILDSRFGDEIYESGLRVYTTLDVDMQRAAINAMEAGWAAIEGDPGFAYPRYEEFDTVEAFSGQTPYLQGAFIALDPHTGHVKALIGGRDFDQSKFDRARLARRQAGSSFKPFVYAAAINSGIPASHIVVDKPVVYPQVSGQDWRPSNFTPDFKGPMTIRRGLYTSTNTIAIQLGWEEVGIESVAQLARRMGIQTEIERFPSTTIGAAEVIPLQVAEAYSTFPTLGTKVRPFPILRVEDAEGNVIWEPQPERTQVLDTLPARIMVSMLEDVVRRGTGYTAVRVTAGLPYDVAAAGKTGTTNDGTDVWFSGFTPNLLATVWFGMDTPVPVFTKGNRRGNATGGGLAGPVWGSFMKQVYYGAEDAEDGDSTSVSRFPGPEAPSLAIPAPWPLPPGLTAVLVDDQTGLKASPWCPSEDSYLEYYIPGTEPTEFCDRTAGRRFRTPRIR